MSNTTKKSTPEVTTTKTDEVRMSKRTGKPVRKYEKTGASKLLKEGISPRTGKPIRKYEKTGNAALRAKGISPRTGKPVRKYVKSGMKADEAAKTTVTSKKTVTSVKVDTSKAPKTGGAKTAKKVVKEVVASDEAVQA